MAEKDFGWRKLSLRKQTFIIYFLGAFTLIAVFFILYLSILGKSLDDHSASRLDSVMVDIERRLDFAIESVAQDAKIIGFSNEVQSYLDDTSTNSEEKNKTKIESSTIGITVGSSLIDSIYIYDFYNNYYAATENTWRENAGKSITSAPWYFDVMKEKGNYIVSLNSGDFFNEVEENYLSVIRLINNVDTLEPIGILIANVPLRNIIDMDIFGEYSAGDDVIWCLTEENGMLLCSSDDRLGNVLGFINADKTGIQKFKLDRKKYDGTYAVYEQAGLQVYAAVERNIFAKDYLGYYITILLLCLLLFVMILVLTQVFTRSIRYPLDSVLRAMNCIKNKNFRDIEIIETNREMTMLQKGYNAMIEEIHGLFDEVGREQKQKRMYELNVLNAQIRPHFLYNTFDSVCALALMERSRDIYLLMQALGKYYRISLHKGDEIISLKEELEIIRNYAVIQKYRFQNVFEIQYEVPEELLNYKILKLVLQPFVENSIYHGLKTKGFRGEILISGGLEDDYLVIKIQDNGIGMSMEKIQKILGGEVDGEERSFGMYGTMQRISLHYGENNLVSVLSEKNQGTSIIIRIPISGDASGGTQKGC